MTFNNGTQLELTDDLALYDDYVQRVYFPGYKKAPLNFYDIKVITFTAKTPTPPWIEVMKT